MLKTNRRVNHFQNLFQNLTVISDSFFVFRAADKLQDREKLFQGGTDDDVKPKVRTAEEIRAAYRKTGVG